MAEQEGEVVVDPALLVVQIGVTDPAGLHLYDGLPRSRIGHEDRLHPHRLVLAGCDHSAYLLRHGPDPFCRPVYVPPTLRVTDQ
ncbi:hypothetical protein RKD25_000874 [Streptomyces sp. SAI-124]